MTRSRDVADTQDNLGGAVAPYVAGKNGVINGGMDIWQRGTSIAQTAPALYTADRWLGYQGTATAVTYTRQATGDTTNLPFIQYCARIQRNSGSTAGSQAQFAQTFESINSIPYAGKTITMSFYARRGANYSMNSNNVTFGFITGTGTDQNVLTGFTGAAATYTDYTLTTTWQRFTYTQTIPTTATQIGFAFFFTPTGTAGANDWFEVTGVQLEVGSVATPFARAGGSIGGELALCQRYYFRTTGGGTFQPLCFGFASSSTNVMGYLQYPVTMRTSPTVIEFSQISTNDSTVGYPVSAVAFSGTEYGPQGATLNFTTSAMTTFRPTKILQYSTSAGYLALGAEL
jgi:hypothetical protein